MKPYLLFGLAITLLSCNDGRNSLGVEPDQQANFKEVAIMLPPTEPCTSINHHRSLLIRNGHLNSKQMMLRKQKQRLKK